MKEEDLWATGTSKAATRLMGLLLEFFFLEIGLLEELTHPALALPFLIVLPPPMALLVQIYVVAITSTGKFNKISAKINQKGGLRTQAWRRGRSHEPTKE